MDKISVISDELLSKKIPWLLCDYPTTTKEGKKQYMFYYYRINKLKRKDPAYFLVLFSELKSALTTIADLINKYGDEKNEKTCKT